MKRFSPRIMNLTCRLLVFFAFSGLVFIGCEVHDLEDTSVLHQHGGHEEHGHGDHHKDGDHDHKDHHNHDDKDHKDHDHKLKDGDHDHKKEPAGEKGKSEGAAKADASKAKKGEPRNLGI